MKSARIPSRVNGALWAVLLLLLGALLHQMVSAFLSNFILESRTVSPRGDLAPWEKTTIEIYRKAAQSVVFITTESIAVPRSESSDGGAGSGIVWDKDGHIVTNRHVIKNAATIEVTLPDETRYPARLVGSFPELDLAVLKISAPKRKLTTIPIGQSHDLQVGQFIMAIGSPYGLQRTLTTGVVSGLGRRVRTGQSAVSTEYFSDFIQTDASINLGNSGGPLLDSAGRLIGLNSRILSKSGDSGGIGFALPVDYLRQAVPLIQVNGRQDRAGLGVLLESDETVLNLIASKQLRSQGALIGYVVPGSSAYNVGLRASFIDSRRRFRVGDLIVRFDGQEIRSGADLIKMLQDREIGDRVDIEYWREGSLRSLTVQLTVLSSMLPAAE